MAHGTKTPTFAKLPGLVTNYDKLLINYTQTRQRARQRERQGIGQNKGQVRPDYVLLRSCIINESTFEAAVFKGNVATYKVLYVTVSEKRDHSVQNVHSSYKQL